MKENQFTVGNCKIVVVEGDITKIDANAIITPINSNGDWDGGVDNAIFDVARNHFHDQVRGKVIQDLEVVFARGKRNMPLNRGNFDNVIFVIDDLKSSLSSVVESGLSSADYHSMEEVLLPAMRTGVVLGQIESSMDEVADQITAGIQRHFVEISDSIIAKITIVIYNNEEFESAIIKRLKKI